MKRIGALLLAGTLLLAACDVSEGVPPEESALQEQGQALPYDILEFYSGESDGMFFYRNRDTGEHGYLDMWGNEVLPEEEEQIRQPAQRDGAYGVLSGDQWLVEPVYDWIGDFSEGLAPFRQDNLWGYLDGEGNEAIPARYLSAWSFSEGLAAVELLAEDVDPREKMVGYIDRTGSMVIEPRVMSTYGIGQYREGLARISVGEFPDYRDVYIDREGNEIFRCYRGTDFWNGAAVVTILYEDWRPADPDAPYYMYETAVINTQGEFLFRPEYPSVGQGRDQMDSQYLMEGWLAISDYAVLERDPNGDFYNLTGYESSVTADGLVFDTAKPLETAEIPKIYISPEGERLEVRNYAPNHFTFQAGLAYYEGADGAYGYIDTQGQLAVDLVRVSDALGEPVLRYGEAPYYRSFSGGYARLGVAGGMGLLDPRGGVAFPPVASGITEWFSTGEDTIIWLPGGDFVGLDGVVRFRIAPTQDGGAESSVEE